MLIGLFCLALWPGLALAQQGSWEGYIQAATAAYQPGDHAEAEKQISAALKVAQGFDREDPRAVAKLATTLNNLGELYRLQGKYAEAEPLHQRALAIREKALGPEQPDVAMSLENYADLLRETGRSTEAAKLDARASAIRTKHAEQNLVK